MKEKKVCKVCGCDNKARACGYCAKHYQQVRRNGKVTRVNFKKTNDIIYYNDYAELISNDKYGNEVGRIQIDLEDVDKVKNYKWGISCGNYIKGKINGKQILLHRFIMGVVDNKEVDVDHIDGNPFNNRKSNLRVCSHTENMRNQKQSKSNTSGRKGVYWRKDVNKWVAGITVDKKYIHIGYFKTKEEAIEARKKAEAKYFGEFNRDEEYL